MSSLYKLTEEMEDLLQAEDTDEYALEVVFGNIQEKAQSICQFIATLGADIQTFKTEEQRLATRRKAMENKLEAVKIYLCENMERLGIDKLDAGTFSIALQDSPPAVVVDEETTIPPRYFVLIPESKQLDKKQVAADLKAGKTVSGCHLQHKKHVRIR